MIVLEANLMWFLSGSLVLLLSGCLGYLLTVSTHDPQSTPFKF